MIYLLRNAVRQFRRFWLSALFLVIGSAAGLAGIAMTLGSTVDVLTRSVELAPPDLDRTMTFAVSPGSLTTDMVYNALRGVPGWAAVVIHQPVSVKVEGVSGTATSLDLDAEIWTPPMIAGKYLAPSDIDPVAPPPVIIGQEIARAVFPGQSAVGKLVTLSLDETELRCQVLGVIGVQGRLTAWDRAVVLPGWADRNRPVAMFQVKAPSSELLPKLAVDIAEAFRVALPEGRLTVVPAPGPATRASEAPAVFAATGLAVLILLVSSVNCGNLAGFWVRRRRREIAIRMVLGAAPRTVLTMVLVEVTLLNLAGALVGLAIYAAVVAFSGEYLPMSLTLHWPHVGVAVLTASLSGLAAGLVPGIQAARLDPTEILKTE